jgi:hypothetical protein
MVLLVLDALAGLLLLAGIAAAVTRGNSRQASSERKALGWALIVIPLPLAVGLHLAGRLSLAMDQSAFFLGVAAFAVGAALVITAADDDDFHSENRDDPPPWWPDFEREFQEYARNTPAHRGRPLVRT